MNITEEVNTILDELEYENFVKIPECDDYQCDGKCEKSLKELVEEKTEIYYYQSNKLIVFCENCLNDNPKSGFEEVDRLKYSIDEKPLMWPCLFCGEKQGGGCKWYCNSTIDVDICKKCFELDIVDKYTKIKNLENFYVCDRSINPVLVNVEKVENLKVPEEIANEVTQERIEKWLTSLDSIVSTDHKIKNMCTWLPFTDEYDIPNYPALTMLLVNCDPTGKEEVASVVFDDHGRMAINVIFDNFLEYQKAFEEWTENKLSNEERFKQTNKIKTDFRENHEADDQEMAKTCEEFSGYIRLHRILGMYYG